MRRELLFYSDFPFGYHNREAEERMERLAARGYRVRYVEQLGIRNPHPRHVARLLRTLISGGETPSDPPPFDVISPKLLAPRGAAPIAAFNRRWLARQLQPRLSDPAEAIVWVRYPTPELVAFVKSAGAWRVAYEAVDDHVNAPGLSRRLRARAVTAERDLLALAGVAFASSEPIRRRLAALHPNVVRLPAAAVDVDSFAGAARAVAPIPRTALYAGTADDRFDAELVADVAARLSDWEFKLVGRVDPDVRRRLAAAGNVSLLGLLPPDEVPALIASAAVCIAPYGVGTWADSLFPIKLVESLAGGRPVVATPIEAAREFAGLIETAVDAPAFAAGMLKAVAGDSAEMRRRRTERIRPFSWEARLDELEKVVAEAPGPPGSPR